MFKLSAISISIITVFFSPVSVFANNDSIEVIEVYAQKRKQTLEEVSISIATLKGDNITSQGIKDISEVGGYVANFKISQNAAEGTPPALNIRGVGLIDYNTANTSPIAMYIDGRPVGSANNQIANLFDVEQIEVLKGPQGTLFGRNSTGGALLVRTKRPDDGNYGFIKAGAGTDEWRRVQGAYNAKVNELSALRFSFNHTDYEYTSYNLFDASPEAGLKQQDARLSYLAEWDEFTLYAKLEYGHWDGIVQPVGNIGIFKDPANGVRCSAAEAGGPGCFDMFGFNDGSDDYWAVSVNNDSPHLSIYKGWTVQGDWRISDSQQLTYINGFNRLDRRHAFNCDGSPARLCEGELGLKNEMLSNELRYSQTNDRDHLTLGLFHIEERIYQDNFNDILRDYRGLLSTDLTNTFFYDNEIIVKSVAAFAQYEWQLNDAHRITVGLRYSDETVEYDSVSRLNTVADITQLDGVTIPYYRVNGEVKDDGLSGRLAWNYQYSDPLMFYYSFANGTKSGGYNGGLLATEEQAKLADYGPEELYAHEIGAKYNNADNLSVNGAVFFYDYSDQQVFMNQASTVPGAPPLQLLENVGSSTIYGAELAIQYKLNDALKFRSAAGYVPEANFDEFIDPVGNVLTDNRLPFTPEWNINGDVTHTMSFLQGELASTIGFDYQSEYYFDQNQNAYAMQSGYTLWRGSVHYERGDWRFGVWGKNLFDKEYSHLKFDLSAFLGMLEDFKGEGRRLGVDISYRF
ncbi:MULTISPECIES: TonB-dependent receptor [Pseudoalteromonas]|uniref:TonB-dependent receptor n=1 Tax=Pseudoalteromonas TaxID=53246 RepID=UPI000F7858DD|nr:MULTISPECIES: TonB-dependent receptor [Pseudoalteromonas]